MSYNFNPLSEEELDAMNLMEDGIYDFEVIKGTKKISSSGNPMCELQLRVWDMNGKVHTIFDYLVFSSVNLNIKKVKHFCESVGWGEKYKQGNIAEEMEMLCGKVEIAQCEKQPKKDGSGFYPAKNIVNDYITKDKSSLSSSVSATQDFNDNLSDIPF